MTVEKVAIVTAGGTGIGAATARQLTADGFRVGIISSTGKGEALASELGGISVTGSSESVEDLVRLIDLVRARWGRIDVLVNSVGQGPRGPLVALGDEQWLKGLNTYLLGVLRPMQLVVPIMQKQRSGVIVNVTADWALEPGGLPPGSSMVRSGLAAFTRLFVESHSQDNIRMNNVLPGWIDTTQVWEDRRVAVPLQRYGKAEEVAAAVGFLASQAASYITGQSLSVDGGVTRPVS